MIVICVGRYCGHSGSFVLVVKPLANPEALFSSAKLLTSGGSVNNHKSGLASFWSP